MASATTGARYLQSKHVFGRVHLQKLVFYSQAWSLAWTGRPLFEEDIQAWEGGPVTPSVWEQQKHGDLEVDRSALTTAEIAVVDAVYSHYGSIGGTQLSRMTHREAPWKDAWDDGRGRNSVISKSAMRRSYTERALLEPARAPVAPVLSASASPADVAEAGEHERARWRSLLDRLARQ